MTKNKRATVSAKRGRHRIKTQLQNVASAGSKACREWCSGMRNCMNFSELYKMRACWHSSVITSGLRAFATLPGKTSRIANIAQVSLKIFSLLSILKTWYKIHTTMANGEKYRYLLYLLLYCIDLICLSEIFRVGFSDMVPVLKWFLCY